MSNWNKFQTTQLIMLYEQHPVLYNSQCEDALDRIKKIDALKSITEELKAYRPEVTQDEVKSKIKTLRSQYIREKNAINKSKKSGAGINEIYSPKLWCFEELNFLNNFIKSTPSISNIAQISSPTFEESLGTESWQDEIHQSYQDCSREKKRKTGLEMQISRSLQVAEEMASNMRQKSQTKRTKAYNLGKFVEQELEDIAEDLFMESKWKIMEVIREVQEKNFMRKDLQNMNKQNTNTSSITKTNFQTIPTHIRSYTPDSSSTLLLNTQKQASQHERIVQTPKSPFTLANSQQQNDSSHSDTRYSSMDSSIQNTNLQSMPPYIRTYTPNSTASLFPNPQNQTFQHKPITQTPKTSKPKTIFIKMQPPK